MRFRKITLDSRAVFRKRRLHFNPEVSGWCDEFSCEGEAEFVSSKKHPSKVMPEVDALIAALEAGGFSGYTIPTITNATVSYGVSKRENLISDHFTINGMRPVVGST